MGKHKIGCVQHDCNECKTIQQRLAELQQQSAMQQREIMRLREALEEIERYGDCKVCYAESTKALSTPTTYDSWHEAQLGEPVAWKYTRRDGQVTATVNPAFALIVESDGFEVTPLYAKKG